MGISYVIKIKAPIKRIKKIKGKTLWAMPNLRGTLKQKDQTDDMCDSQTCDLEWK